MDFACDRKIAISQENGIIEAISQKANELGIAVGFGYLELSDDKIYSSYLFIDKTGIILNNYRRISPGWKEPVASEKHYREGEIFQTFSFMDKTFLLGLCGDFWYDENVKRANQLYQDVVLWPVYLKLHKRNLEQFRKRRVCNKSKTLGETGIAV